MRQHVKKTDKEISTLDLGFITHSFMCADTQDSTGEPAESPLRRGQRDICAQPTKDICCLISRGTCAGGYRAGTFHRRCFSELEPLQLQKGSMVVVFCNNIPDITAPGQNLKRHPATFVSPTLSFNNTARVMGDAFNLNGASNNSYRELCNDRPRLASMVCLRGKEAFIYKGIGFWEKAWRTFAKVMLKRMHVIEDGQPNVIGWQITCPLMEACGLVGTSMLWAL